MSGMQIEIVNVSVSNQGKYQIADVAYKNKTFGDKLEGKKIVSFSYPEVFNVLSKASFGNVFTIHRAKNDKNFWDWTAVDSESADAVAQQVAVPAAAAYASTAAAAATMKATPSPKSTYETPEERARRQVLIVRQSSISSALEYAVANKIKDVAEILALASTFEAHVFREGDNAAAAQSKPVAQATQVAEGNHFADLEDDLP